MRQVAAKFGIAGALARWIGVGGLAAASMLSAGCASRSSMGISLVPGEALPELQQLARRARTGDKQAQLELGYLYEAGHKVARNVNRARSLYLLAAKDTDNIVWIYTPSPGNGAPARVVSVGRALGQPGLDAARKGLQRLDAARHEAQ